MVKAISSVFLSPLFSLIVSKLDFFTGLPLSLGRQEVILLGDIAADLNQKRPHDLLGYPIANAVEKLVRINRHRVDTVGVNWTSRTRSGISTPGSVAPAQIQIVALSALVGERNRRLRNPLLWASLAISSMRCCWRILPLASLKLTPINQNISVNTVGGGVEIIRKRDLDLSRRNRAIGVVRQSDKIPVVKITANIFKNGHRFTRSNQLNRFLPRRSGSNNVHRRQHLPLFKRFDGQKAVRGFGRPIFLPTDEIDSRACSCCQSDYVLVAASI